MIVAQISDPHVSLEGARLSGGYDPAAALAAVLVRVAGLVPRPDFVVFTGDLTDHGLPDEYDHLVRLLDGFDLPSAAIPGNHDRRDAFEAALAPTPVAIGSGPWLHLTVEDWPLRLIALDTLALDGESAGNLDDARLAWIERQLESAPDRPTLIFMHHPPFATGIAFMDAMGCLGGDRLAAIVKRHKQVLGVTCGHVHRAVTTPWAGIVAGICPSVAWQVPLVLDPAAPPAMIPQSPGFQLHVWTPVLGLVTHTEFLVDAA